MRGEIFVFLLVVGLSVCANSYYGKPEGWYPDGWDGFGFGRADYGMGQYDEEKFGEFWGKSGDWKRSDDKKEDKKDVEEKTDENKDDEHKDDKKDDAEGHDKEEDDNEKDSKKNEDEKNDGREYCYYPCKGGNEDCIRNFLSTNGHCVPVYKYNNKEKIYRERAVLYLSKFNLTVTMTDSQIEGLEGKVDKFYINKETGNLIFSVDFKRISVDSKISYFEFHRQGQEPIRAADFVKVTYAPMVLTAVIPFNFYGLSMKQARVTAYISANPVFEVGPKVSKNPDPVIQKTVASYTADVSTAVQETFLTEAYNLFISYLQNYICNFGVRI